jgi:hypothetical protein
MPEYSVIVEVKIQMEVMVGADSEVKARSAGKDVAGMLVEQWYDETYLELDDGIVHDLVSIRDDITVTDVEMIPDDDDSA